MQPKPKPIKRSTFGITSRTNVPYDQPLTPGLRRQQPTSAIGFMADLGDTNDAARAMMVERARRQYKD